MNCKICGKSRAGMKGICGACRDKRTSIRTHRVFRTHAEQDRAKLILEHRKKCDQTQLPRPDTSKSRVGEGTKKLVDYVNKSGTVHYGRYVAKEKGYLK